MYMVYMYINLCVFYTYSIEEHTHTILCVFYTYSIEKVSLSHTHTTVG